jgi:hypothetical protein
MRIPVIPDAPKLRRCDTVPLPSAPRPSDNAYYGKRSKCRLNPVYERVQGAPPLHVMLRAFRSGLPRNGPEWRSLWQRPTFTGSRHRVRCCSAGMRRALRQVLGAISWSRGLHPFP